MTIIILALVIFLELIFYLVVFDVILSWLTLAGVRFRPRFVRDVLDPLYSFIRKYIPTRFGAFDFTPIIIIFGSSFIKSLIVASSPEVSLLLNQLSI